MDESRDELSHASIDTDKFEETLPESLSKTKNDLDKSSPEKAQPSKKVPVQKISKAEGSPVSKEDTSEKIKDTEQDLPTDIQSEDDSMSEGSSDQISPSVSEAPSTSKATESIASKEDTQPAKTKKNEKQTMDEKIAAQKAKKGVKEEEPVFAGMKLKKSKQLQRQWTEQELETVKLKDHQFEQFAQIETVILIHFRNLSCSRYLEIRIDHFSCIQ